MTADGSIPADQLEVLGQCLRSFNSAVFDLGRFIDDPGEFTSRRMAALEQAEDIIGRPIDEPTKRNLEIVAGAVENRRRVARPTRPLLRVVQGGAA